MNNTTPPPVTRAKRLKRELMSILVVPVIVGFIGCIIAIGFLGLVVFLKATEYLQKLTWYRQKHDSF